MKTKLATLIIGFIWTLSSYSQAESPVSYDLTFYKNGNFTKQIMKDSLKLPVALLLKYCGDYIPADKDKQLIPMSIVIDGYYIYRRLNGDSDRRLIPKADNTFFYDDGSGRNMEFVRDKQGEVSSVILSREDGDFELKKLK